MPTDEKIYQFLCKRTVHKWYQHSKDSYAYEYTQKQELQLEPTDEKNHQFIWKNQLINGYQHSKDSCLHIYRIKNSNLASVNHLLTFHLAHRSHHLKHQEPWLVYSFTYLGQTCPYMSFLVYRRSQDQGISSREYGFGGSS